MPYLYATFIYTLPTYLNLFIVIVKLITAIAMFMLILAYHLVI